jgi:uncharacterized protein (DUF58 family)
MNGDRKADHGGDGRGQRHRRHERRRLFDEAFVARLEPLHLIAKRLALHGRPGLRRSRRLGDGLDLADHRAYAPGDDTRYIDWPYFGRMEKLLLRLFHEQGQGRTTLLLDASASMAVGDGLSKFDYARRVAAALAYLAMGGLEQVRLCVFGDGLGDALATGRQRARILPVLDWLADLTAAGPTRLLDAAELLVRRWPEGGQMIIISDLMDCQEQLAPALARLRQGGQELAVIHVISPADARPSLNGPLLLEQAEGGQCRSITVTPELLESYVRQWAAFCRGCQAVCLAERALYLPAETDWPPERLVLQTLRQAGLVGQ